jgi:hypothetical protein
LPNSFTEGTKRRPALSAGEANHLCPSCFFLQQSSGSSLLPLWHEAAERGWPRLGRYREAYPTRHEPPNSVAIDPISEPHRPRRRCRRVALKWTSGIEPPIILYRYTAGSATRSGEQSAVASGRGSGRANRIQEFGYLNLQAGAIAGQHLRRR